MTGQIVSLSTFRGRREDVPRALALYRIDPDRYGVATTLARLLSETGAKKGRVIWYDVAALDWGYPTVTVGGGWSGPSRMKSGPGSAIVDLEMGTDADRRLWVLRLVGDGPVQLERAGPLARFMFSMFSALGRFAPRRPRPSTADEPPIARLINVLGEWADFGWEVRRSVGPLTARIVGEGAARCEDPEEGRLIQRAMAFLEAYDIEALGWTLVGLGELLENRGDLVRAELVQRLAYETAIATVSVPLGCRAARLAARPVRKLSRFAEAEGLYRLAAELADIDGLYTDLAIAEIGLANIAANQGAFPRARMHYTAALGVATAADDPTGQAMALQGLSYLDYGAKRYAAAAAGAVQAARLYPTRTDQGFALVQLGGILLELAATTMAKKAFTLGRQLCEDANTRALAAHGLSHVAARRGDELGFRRMRKRADPELQVAAPRIQVQAAFFDARSFIVLGHLDEARASYQAAIALAEQLGMHQYSERSYQELEAINANADPLPPLEERRIGAHLQELAASL